MASTGSNSSVRAAEAEAAQVENAAPAEVVVGLTSHNDAATIGAVVHAVQAALETAGRADTARLVLADAGSSDGTREVVRGLVAPPRLIELEYARGATFREMPYHGAPGRATALRGILEAAHQLGARACAVVDANRQAADPACIDLLMTPVLRDGFDYVSPYYARHANEGAMTKGIVYPVFRALYGARLRQPAASEFGCSGRLLSHYLAEPFWEAEHAAAGIDLWLAVAAACGDFLTCEAALGAREVSPRGAPADLSTTLAQVAGALFADLDTRVDGWQRVRGSVEVPMVGTVPALETDGPSLNLDGLVESFRLGSRELRDIWTWVLPPRTIVELRKMSDAPPDRFVFDDRLWATIIYDFAFGYCHPVMPRDHLLRSLTPLYSGWLASFAREMRGAGLAQADERVEQLCLAFEAEKRYLISRWRWPERLR
ncbi:MAG: glycosyl transferase family 2 [Vicinamibacteraceae bacterium]|nr:glycosyl transferase family 2 [Vicinamibacteraceae bacterium]